MSINYTNPKAIKINFIGEIIALVFQPYSIVENEGFCRLVNHLAPKYKMPSKKTMTDKVVVLIDKTFTTKIQKRINEAEYTYV